MQLLSDLVKDMTVRDALQSGSERLTAFVNARRDAELLLLHVLGRNRAWLIAHPEAEITPEQLIHYENLLGRRSRNEPIQYLIERQEFFGFNLRVTPDVLIPRPETEHLVEAALARVSADASANILDVGTGSGAIAITLAAHRPNAAVTAVDLSSAALAVARENAAAHHLEDRIRFLESDLLGAVRDEQFDVIVSNPPYVAQHEPLEPQVARFEPRSALFAGESGLEVYRRLIPQAEKALVSGGWLLMEAGFGQQPALAQLLAGWRNVSFLPDLQGIPRVAIAQKQ